MNALETRVLLFNRLVITPRSLESVLRLQGPGLHATDTRTLAAGNVQHAFFSVAQRLRTSIGASEPFPPPPVVVTAGC